MTPVLAVLLLILSSNTVACVEYHVKTTGSNQNTGTSATDAWKTIRYAASQNLGPGDVVNVYAGLYDDISHGDAWNHILITKSGSIGNHITFKGIPDTNGAKPKVKCASVSCFSINGAGFITIEGFEVFPYDGNPIGRPQGFTYYQRGVNTATTAGGGGNPIGHFIVRNNYFHDLGDNCIAIGGASDVLVENNTVEHCGHLTNNGNSGMSFGVFKENSLGNMAELNGYGLVIRNNIARWNVNLRGCSCYQNQMTDGQGIILDYLNKQHSTYNKRTLIEGNVCYGNGARGINIFQSQHVDVRNNILFDNVQTTRIANPAYTVAFSDNGELGVQNSDDVIVENNIYFARGSGGTYAQQSSNNVQTSGNIHWNENGDVPAQSIPSGDVSRDPGFASTPSLSQAQADLLATMTNPFNDQSTSAKLRQPSIQTVANTPFPLPDFTVTQPTAVAAPTGVQPTEAPTGAVDLCLIPKVVEIPKQIGATFSVAVAYRVNEPLLVGADILLDKAPYTWHGASTKKMANGAGTLTLTVPVVSAIPAGQNRYMLKVWAVKEEDQHDWTKSKLDTFWADIRATSRYHTNGENACTSLQDVINTGSKPQNNISAAANVVSFLSMLVLFVACLL